jgi:hypothetical protein
LQWLQDQSEINGDNLNNQPPVTSSLFVPNILLCTLFSDTLSLCEYDMEIQAVPERDILEHFCCNINQVGSSIIDCSLYSGDAHFESRLGNQLYGLRVFVGFHSLLADERVPQTGHNRFFLRTL